MFTTERLRLREWRNTDTPGFMHIWNDERCQKTLSNKYIVPRDTSQVEDDLIKAIFRSPNTILPLAITLKNEAETFLGWITVRSANPKNRDGNLGIAISPEFWNKGYATEALTFVVDYVFREMGLHRLSLEVFEGNDGAKKVYERLGFVVEGVKRKANWFGGRWRDTTIMAIVDEDYWASHPIDAT